MITNHLAKTLRLGFWIAVGTFGCSSGNNNNTPPDSTANAGGSTSSHTSSSSTGGNTNSPASSHAGGATQSGTTNVSTASTGGATGAGGASAATGGTRTNGGTSGAGTTSTGGKTGNGGTSNAGGAKTTTGGGKATGGNSSSTGGTRPAGGTSSQGTGGTSTANTSTQSSGNCSIAQKSGAVSTTIGPVGIVTFTVTGASSLDSAEIKFGLDTNYGLSAPVDVSTASSDYRTLLLGMKAGKAYHYQIVGKSGGNTCTSPDYTITAGGCPTSIKKPTVTTSSGVTKSQLDGGFVVMEGYKATTPDDYAYILDGDGDVVWCYKPSGFSDLTAARMSWDGKYMWLVHGNVPSQTAHMGRIAMDGADWKDYSTDFAGINHDATVLPDDKGVAYIAYSSNGCDDVKLWKPSGGSTTVINSGSVFGTGGGGCHCNAIKYDESDNSLIVSDDDHSGYFKVGLDDSKVKWVLGGGSANQFDKSGGGASTWTGQHNFHILGNDSSGLYHFLFFNNGVSSAGGQGVNAVVRELALDINAKTSKEVWKYEANPGIANQVMGDVQRLDNGNTIIAYSLVGKIQEVDPKGTLLQSLTWTGGGAGIGYITKRRTLYGPPPKAR